MRHLGTRNPFGIRNRCSFRLHQPARCSPDLSGFRTTLGLPRWQFTQGNKHQSTTPLRGLFTTSSDSQAFLANLLVRHSRRPHAYGQQKQAPAPPSPVPLIRTATAWLLLLPTITGFGARNPLPRASWRVSPFNNGTYYPRQAPGPRKRNRKASGQIPPPPPPPRTTP